MNYKDCCRTCLDKTKELRHINSTITIAGAEVSLTEILKNFYEYEVSIQDPAFPDSICINCVHQLTITYSFKHLIDSSLHALANAANQVESQNEDNFECNYESDDDKPIVKLKFNKRDFKPKQKEEIKSLFCVECKAEFEVPLLLSDHCRNNHPVKCTIGRDCEYCDEKFEDYRSLVLHKKLHIRPYLCEQCWDGFYSDDQLKSHTCHPSLFKERKKPDRVLRQCDQCGKSYPPGYIRIHMLTHSSERLYSCKYCPKKFKVPGGLHSHIQWNHKRVRNHKCEICNATFISSSSRSTHIRKNHLKEKKYACDSCGKRFFSKSELQRHSLTHTGVKNFHCHMCDKSYQTRYGLNCHLKSHFS